MLLHPEGNVMDIIQFDRITDKIIVLCDVQVILDSDIAELYGVETRDINKAVKNNPDKFPEGYIISLSKEEFENLRWKFSSTKLLILLNLLKTKEDKFLG